MCVWTVLGDGGQREWVQVAAGLFSCSNMAADVCCRMLGMLQRQRGALLSARQQSQRGDEEKAHSSNTQ